MCASNFTFIISFPSANSRGSGEGSITPLYRRGDWGEESEQIISGGDRIHMNAWLWKLLFFYFPSVAPVFMFTSIYLLFRSFSGLHLQFCSCLSLSVGWWPFCSVSASPLGGWALREASAVRHGKDMVLWSRAIQSKNQEDGFFILQDLIWALASIFYQ